MKDITKAFDLCGYDLVVSEVRSKNSDVIIRGDFQLSKFDYLSREHQYFIEVFIKNQGNIKMIEKELGISYPTVKKTLDEVSISLGYKVDPKTQEVEDKRNDIFEQIRQGLLTIEKAEELLKKIK